MPLVAQTVDRFDYPDFRANGELRMVGDAVLAADRLRLTSAQSHQAGAAWYPRRVRLVDGFETTFRFQLTGESPGFHGGGDGLAFVLQDAGDSAIGSAGSSGGFGLGAHGYAGGGIPKAIAIFFDTFRNMDERDPSDNSLSISTSGAEARHWPPPRLAVAPKLRRSLKDRRVHEVRVDYTPPVLSVYLDDMVKPVLASPVDPATVMDKDGAAFVGFTSSTGAAYENHDVLSWSLISRRVSVTSEISFSNVACLPDRNLCTPEQATVEPLGGNRYHVVLPAHLAWGASVPGANPVLSDLKGRVCRDFARNGAAGCSGPEGGAALEESIQPGSRAGALVWKTSDGQTSFSINGLTRDLTLGQFRDYEGYYEFDVEMTP